MARSATKDELDNISGPHRGQPIHRAGAPLEEARAAVVMLHGRGASAQGMLSLAEEVALSGVAFLAPQAARRTWYPRSFLAPLERNEPHLSSALEAVSALITSVEEEGVAAEKTVLMGFSQGACLASESAARNARRYGGVIAFSGGLLGTSGISGASPPSDKRFEYDGDLDGTPVFVGCSDVDPHIPLERVKDTTRTMEALGGSVTERIYEGMGHTVNQDEIDFTRTLLEQLTHS